MISEEEDEEEIAWWYKISKRIKKEEVWITVVNSRSQWGFEWVFVGECLSDQRNFSHLTL